MRIGDGVQAITARRLCAGRGVCCHLPAAAHLGYVLGRRAPPESRCRSVSLRNEGQILRGKTHCGLLAVRSAYVAGRADEAR